MKLKNNGTAFKGSCNLNNRVAVKGCGCATSPLRLEYGVHDGVYNQRSRFCYFSLELYLFI